MWGIRGVLIDLGALQRPRVHERRMTATVVHDHRVVRSCGVEVGALQRPRRLGVVVEEADDPLARRRGGGFGMNGVLDSLYGVHLQCHLRQQRDAPIAGMGVRVVEAGRHPLAAQIDTPRARSRQGEHLRAGADRQHARPAHGQGLRLRLARAHGEDGAVVQHQIGPAIPARERRGTCRSSRAEKRATGESLGHDTPCGRQGGARSNIMKRPRCGLQDQQPPNARLAFGQRTARLRACRASRAPRVRRAASPARAPGRSRSARWQRDSGPAR